MLRYVHRYLGQGGGWRWESSGHPLWWLFIRWASSHASHKGKELKMETGGAGAGSWWLGNSDACSRLNLMRLQGFPLNVDRSKQTRRTWADTVASLGQPQAITQEERSLYLRGTGCVWRFTPISPMKTMAR